MMLRPKGLRNLVISDLHRTAVPLLKKMRQSGTGNTDVNMTKENET